jgi:hypothetical protein
VNPPVLERRMSVRHFDRAAERIYVFETYVSPKYNTGTARSRYYAVGPV